MYYLLSQSLLVSIGIIFFSYLQYRNFAKEMRITLLLCFVYNIVSVIIAVLFEINENNYGIISTCIITIFLVIKELMMNKKDSV